MLKFFFHRTGKIPRLMEMIGVVLCAKIIAQGLGEKTIFILFLSLYIFLRFCATVRWYAGVPRGLGIELHFQQMLVPVSYSLCFATMFYYFFNSTLLLYFSVALFLFLASLNSILLCLHFKDKTGLPINSFTHPTQRVNIPSRQVL